MKQALNAREGLEEHGRVPAGGERTVSVTTFGERRPTIFADPYGPQAGMWTVGQHEPEGGCLHEERTIRLLDDRVA